MRRVLLAILAIARIIGCSRQPPPHLGEWDTKFYLVGNIPLSVGSCYFSGDGKGWDRDLAKYHLANFENRLILTRRGFYENRI